MSYKNITTKINQIQDPVIFNIVNDLIEQPVELALTSIAINDTHPALGYIPIDWWELLAENHPNELITWWNEYHDYHDLFVYLPDLSSIIIKAELMTNECN